MWVGQDQAASTHRASFHLTRNIVVTLAALHRHLRTIRLKIDQILLFLLSNSPKIERTL